MDALAQLRVVSGAFAEGLRTADPQAGMPGTDWTVAGLVRHLGQVHRWAAGNARGSERLAWSDADEVEPARLAQWYAECRAVLLEALGELDPAQSCWTFSPTDRTVAFWHRRQLHEVLVHLWDLRSAMDAAAPPPAEVGAEVYADTVEEMFDLFLGRRESEPLSEALTLRATDCDREWVIQPDWSLGGPAAAAATVAATAGELALFVWNRMPAGSRFTDGMPPRLLREFRDAKARP